MIFKQESVYGVPNMMQAQRPRLTLAQRAVMKWATLEEYDRVLDMDCGDSALLCALDEAYHVSLCGVCQSARLARAARSELPHMDVVYAKAADVPFRSDSFDEVFIARNTGSNCQDEALDEAYRVLRPGGQIVIATRPMTLLFAAGEPEMDKRSIMRALQCAGFKDVSWRSAGLCGVIVGWKNRKE